MLKDFEVLNSLRLSKYKKVIKKINAYEQQFADWDDATLQNQTDVFKQRLASGEKLESLLPEAFATICEADYRILGKRPYDEQKLGGVILFHGNIAEMKTGEGKTLTATMPIYLNSLTGKGGMIVTANDYLAHRDFCEIGPVYEWLGLSIGDGSAQASEQVTKKELYKSDVIYIPSANLGFDYLINSLASHKSERFMRSLNYALIDEVDAILLDNAQSPLIITGAPKVQSNYFKSANFFIKLLVADQDFKKDKIENVVWFTKSGIKKAENYFGIKELMSIGNYELYQHLVLALKAHETLKANKDYVVKEGEIKLLDYQNGRILEGMRLQGGLQQAVEVKESIELSDESRTLASITYQNLYRRFNKISGMSGTAKIAENEFIDTYNMPVLVVPTHKKNQRFDHASQVYMTLEEKFSAVLALIQKLADENRPMLCITGSVDLSELLSEMLLNVGISHSLLNAKNDAREAQIIGQAGHKGFVTVATMMAGRGTDIRLESGISEIGGLAVIVTERLPSSRVDFQVKGRAGRQGDFGETFYFESLEDDVVAKNTTEKVKKKFDHYRQRHLLKYKKHNHFRRYTRQAQRVAEDRAKRARINAVQYDEIIRLQKTAVDDLRDSVLNTTDSTDFTTQMVAIRDNIFKQFVGKRLYIDARDLGQYILDHLDYNFKWQEMQGVEAFTKEEALDILRETFEKTLAKKRENFDDELLWLRYLKAVYLKTIDSIWVNQIDALNEIRSIVSSRAVAQKEPIIEFQREAMQSFKENSEKLRAMLVKNILLSELVPEKESHDELQIVLP